MITIVLYVVSIFALYEISKWVMELAGKPILEPPESEGKLKTVIDLRVELGEYKIPESVYMVFQRGVEFQLGGQHQDALQEYGKLREIPRSGGGTFDLAEVSLTLKHNLRLLSVEDEAQATGTYKGGVIGLAGRNSFKRRSGGG